MNAPAQATMSCFSRVRRVSLIAQNTLRAAARQKLFHLLVLLAFGLVVGARWFRDFNLGAPELKFLADCGLGAMSFFGAALAITATAQLFFSEIETRTVQTVLAKPVWRAEFIAGKFLGVAVLLLGFCVLLTVLLAAVMWSRETVLMQEFPEAFGADRQVNYAALVLAGTMQWLKLLVLAALTLLVASFAQSQIFTVISGFALLVICHLQHLAQDAYAGGASLMGRLIGGAIASVFPTFQVFSLADALEAELPAAGEVVRVFLYALGYAAVAGGLAAFSFQRREI